MSNIATDAPADTRAHILDRARVAEILHKDGIEEDDLDRNLDILERLDPCSKRLIVNKPEVSAYADGRELDSGLTIPDIALGQFRQFGLVAHVLRLAADVDLDIEPGDRVIIPEYGGTPIYMNEALPFYIIPEGDILVRLRDEDTT